MPRQERPLDEGDTPLLRFAADLRQLRAKCGAPTYRQLALRAHTSAASLSVAAGGRRLPTLAVTIAYVEGCGGDVDAWRLRWHDLAAWYTTAEGPAGAGSATAGGLGALGPAAEGLAGAAGPGAAEGPAAAGGLAAPAGLGTPAGPGTGPGTGPAAPRTGGGRATPRLRATAGRPETEGVIPYPGAAPFRTADARWFFGREALAADLRERLRHRRVVTVTGPSGAGKTSLLNAGLIAPLRAEGHGGPVVLLTPGADVLRNAARWLARLGGVPSTRSGEPVLVVDQFEELFAPGRPAAERRRLLDLLGSAVAAGRVRIVLCSLVDAYDVRPDRSPSSSLFFDDPLVVGPMAPEDLRRAVTEPAARAGYAAREDLVAVLVASAAGQPGALPLVAVALREVWRRREGGVLSLSALRAIGGLDAVAARCAETAWAELPEALHGRARSVLLRLTASERQAAPPGPAAVALSDLDDDPATRIVLERLSRGRALTLDRHSVRWAHASMPLTWTRLAWWLETEAADLRVQRRLTEAARAWHDRGRPRESLYRGADLADARVLVGRNGYEPTPREREFLDAAAQARLRRRRAAAAERIRLRSQRRIIIVLTAALMAVVTAAPLLALHCA